MKNIGIYLYDQAEVLDFSGPFEVFTTAARVSAGENPFQVFLISEQGGTVTARAGYRVQTDYGLHNHPPLDALLVVGGVHTAEMDKPAVIAWIAQQAERVPLVASVCTGAFLLAKAGLLQGLRVTTHWEDQADLQRLFPDLHVVAEVRWVDVGHRVTSGGISAGIDMSLHLVHRLHSLALAEKTARQMEFVWTHNPPDLFTPLTFRNGLTLRNRFTLAPLTNCQSYPDGCLSDDEFQWLTLRAEGGFGLTMTCATHVQAIGNAFPGQLGFFSDAHDIGLQRLAKAINATGSLSVAQLHHGGMRCPAELIGTTPVCPSANEKTGARALTQAEVQQVVADFILAAQRAEKNGFHGVELHGAHSYLLCEFLSAEFNQRTDEYGGSYENRTRIVREIISGIRAVCSARFLLGLRLSPERFGVDTREMIRFSQELMQGGQLDFLELSMWDVFKQAEDASLQDKSLLAYFTELERGATKLGFAGKVRTPDDAQRLLEAGADFVVLGRAAIVQADYPNRLASDAGFVPLSMPVSVEHLRTQGVSETFMAYLRRTFTDVVAEE